jgi:hypothetical protein
MTAEEMRGTYISSLSHDQVRSIMNSSKERFRLGVNNLIEKKCDDLLMRQRGSPSTGLLRKSEVVLFGADYTDIMVDTAAQLDRELFKVLRGPFPGLDEKQSSWIQSQVEEFLKSLTSPSTAEGLFWEAFSGRLTIEDAEESKQQLLRQLIDQGLRVHVQGGPLTAINKTALDINDHRKPRRRRNKRTSVVRPLLDAKGWSDHDWARNSRVDFHTAREYLRGKRNPYPSTRKKLAESLGISTEDLPE